MSKKTSASKVKQSVFIKQIQEVINTKIRDAIVGDGGDITFEKFEKGVVYIKLHGACVGCPGAFYTLKNSVENVLKYYIPEVKEVRNA